MSDYPASAYRELCAAHQALRAERDEALAAIQQVRDLHVSMDDGMGWDADGRYGELGPCCVTCGTVDEYGVPYPCPTIRALDGAS